MKHLLIIASLLFSISSINAQSTANIHTSSTLSLSNIEFSLYPNPAHADFKLEFLMPRDQEMEVFLIDLSGDRVKTLLTSQNVEAGIRTFDFDFPAASPHGTYFVVIKSHGKSVIKKIEHQAKI